MRIFDRKFLQYQLAYGVWYNLKARFLFIAISLVVVTFFTYNLTYLYLVPLMYIYGYGRLIYLFNVSDEKFHKRMERQYEFYQKKNNKAQGKYAFQLEKILFAVELNKLSVKDAIEDIKELLSTRPKVEKMANGVLLSIYLVGKKEGNIKEIPQELIKHLDFALENEENPNALLDYVRLALKLGNNDLAISLLERAEVKNQLYKKQRYPVLRSIYKTTEVATPYYKYIALYNKGEKEEAKTQLDLAINTSKSKKLKSDMQKEEKFVII